MRFEDKLKKELFEKIRQYTKISREIQKIEDESGKSIQELFDKNEEYAGLHLQLDIIRKEMDGIMIDTKYYPLCGIEIAEKELFNNYLKERKKYPHIEVDLESDLIIKKYQDVEIGDKTIEKYLDFKLDTLKEDIKRRLKHVKTLPISAEIDLRIKNLYKQVVMCYVYGAYDASCVLCRAITELIAKRYIEYKGFGDLLTGKEKQYKKMSVQEILKVRLSMKEEIISLYSKIGNKADNILHNRDAKTEENDSFQLIELLQSFLKKFPKSL